MDCKGAKGGGPWILVPAPDDPPRPCVCNAGHRQVVRERILRALGYPLLNASYRRSALTQAYNGNGRLQWPARVREVIENIDPVNAPSCYRVSLLSGSLEIRACLKGVDDLDLLMNVLGRAIGRPISLRPQDHSLILKFERGAPQAHLGGAKDGPTGIAMQSDNNNGRTSIQHSISQRPH